MTLSDKFNKACSLFKTGSRLLVAFLCVQCLLFAHAEGALALDPAVSSAVRTDLAYGRADEGIGRLRPVLERDGEDAEGHNLLCRIFFQEERWEDAVKECERAVKLAPGKSDFHMWLGRAYGEAADHASYIQAYRMGRKVGTEFEAAVSLDAHNAAALSDLGEFYTEAPAIVGGGLDKADGVAQRIDGIDATRAHELRGRIAEQRKDPATAEAEFKSSIRSSPTPAASWTVLASFYRKQQRWDDMMQAIRSAIAADKDHGVASSYAASLLIRTSREPALALQLLNAYLASRKQSEDVPAFLVHVQLGHLLEQQGDRQAAEREYQSARLLAQDFRGLPRAAGNRSPEGR